MPVDCTDYRDIFLNDRPMMDARAPVEFLKGSFPGVVNLPLMNDHERQRVGTCYKQHGQQAAVELGHQLVSGAIKTERVQAWADFARAHPDGLLYCFRGGLRSQIVQQWLKDEAGIDYPRVGGGYKAMRTFLLDTMDQAVAQCDFVLLGGMTGTGKTEVLTQLNNGLDLEGYANHRGSSFGKSAPAASSSSCWKTRVARSAVARCPYLCIRACSSFQWCGSKTACKGGSSGSCAITWWTCVPSSSPCMARRVLCCSANACWRAWTMCKSVWAVSGTGEC
jgi:tRNA 2-selenouridine synthase